MSLGAPVKASHHSTGAANEHRPRLGSSPRMELIRAEGYITTALPDSRGFFSCTQPAPSTTLDAAEDGSPNEVHSPEATDANGDHFRALAEYGRFRIRGLTLDMTRGKPSPEQLDLSSALLELPGQDHLTEAGEDARNYGGLQGMPEARTVCSPTPPIRAALVREPPS